MAALKVLVIVLGLAILGMIALIGITVAKRFSGGGGDKPERVTITPTSRRGGSGGSVIYFTYAPAVSLASREESTEVLAPVIVEVMRRERRRV